ncbi:MAG: plastocyanin/azurin family copper-binding protein [Gammaproteobacteria bacterium]
MGVKQMYMASRTLAFALLFGVAAEVAAEEHVVEGVVTQWRPMITFAQPGDSLRFKNMTGHDTETIEGMIPEGAEGWKSQLGDEGYNVNLETEGVYVFKCNPHISTGMVGVVVVGDARPPQNLEGLKANLENVKVGRNMVNRALKKLDKALEAQ